MMRKEKQTVKKNDLKEALKHLRRQIDMDLTLAQGSPAQMGLVLDGSLIVIASLDWYPPGHFTPNLSVLYTDKYLEVWREAKALWRARVKRGGLEMHERDFRAGYLHEAGYPKKCAVPIDLLPFEWPRHVMDELRFDWEADLKDFKKELDARLKHLEER
jgi:hypothetical protein